MSCVFDSFSRGRLVPLHWYDEYDHIGYDRSGKRVMKRPGGAGSGVDAALAARDDPNYARTVYDAYNDREVGLWTMTVGEGRLRGCRGTSAFDSLTAPVVGFALVTYPL